MTIYPKVVQKYLELNGGNHSFNVIQKKYLVEFYNH